MVSNVGPAGTVGGPHQERNKGLAFLLRNGSSSEYHEVSLALAAPHPVLDDVVDIALDYLEATGQARIGDDTQYLVASAVLSPWLAGKRHRIRLANDAILAVERAQAALAKARRPGEVHLDALRDLALPSGPCEVRTPTISITRAT